MRPYRDIASVACAQVVCFFLLTHYEPNFFLLHLYQTIVYMAILIMLFYMEDRWAYMIGMLASAAWLVMAYSTGLLGGAGRQLLRLTQGNSPNNEVTFIAAVTGLLAVVMIVVCGRHWRREYAGLGKTRNTFLVSFGVVAVYYAILVVWFWNMIPSTAAKG